MNGLPIFSAASQANELRVEPSGCREGHVRVGGASGTRWRHCRALRRASRFTWTYAFSRTQTSVFISERPLLAQSGRFASEPEAVALDCALRFESPPNSRPS